MILAAGRGERMQPLTATTPKPLLSAGGKPLVAWQIEALARAGCSDIVINASHLADRMQAALGDGSALGVRLHWSIEAEPLETAGGIATAMPLLPPGTVLIVSGDIWTGFDYAALAARAAHLMGPGGARVHLVMVPNPAWHPRGDFALAPASDAAPVRRLLPRSDAGKTGGPYNCTYGNIGLYDTALFRELPRGARLQLAPFLSQWIGEGIVTGELYEGPWWNVGTPAQLAELDAALHALPRSTAKARP
jgi:MurNAc alpha-1-phosphate uridylyltransferase